MTGALDQAISPSEAVAKLQKAGINISERTLRERARKLGACRILGKTMFLMPDDIDTIVDAAKPEPKTCQNSTSEKAATTGTTTSRSTAYDTEDLLRRLTGGSRKTSQPRKMQGSVVPLSTARKRS